MRQMQVGHECYGLPLRPLPHLSLPHWHASPDSFSSFSGTLHRFRCETHSQVLTREEYPFSFSCLVYSNLGTKPDLSHDWTPDLYGIFRRYTRS